MATMKAGNHLSRLQNGPLVASAVFCALITLDKSGHPQVRTMDPFPPEDNMVVWLGTNTNSRKVKEIRNDPRVSLYYEAPNARGYVVIQGRAYLKDDPEKLEIIDYTNGINASPKTWTVPNVEFE